MRHLEERFFIASRYSLENWFTITTKQCYRTVFIFHPVPPRNTDPSDPMLLDFLVGGDSARAKRSKRNGASGDFLMTTTKTWQIHGKKCFWNADFNCHEKSSFLMEVIFWLFALWTRFCTLRFNCVHPQHPLVCQKSTMSDEKQFPHKIFHLDHWLGFMSFAWKPFLWGIKNWR